MIFYLVGCDLLNDFTKENADQTSTGNGISGVWFSSNPRITLDTIKLQIGLKTLRFCRKEAASGIHFELNPAIFPIYRDSSIHLILRLSGRHLLINSYMVGMVNGAMMGYICQDSLLALTKHISGIYCDGSQFEAIDSLDRVCLGIYLEDSNAVRIRGYFAGKLNTMIIDDKEIKVYSKRTPSYVLNCNSSAAALIPRHDFSKKVSKL